MIWQILLTICVMWFFGALWWVAFQSEPWTVGIATVVGIILTYIKETV